MPIFYFTFLTLAIYAILITIGAWSWYKKKSVNYSTPPSSAITIVICCKNEADNLPVLIASIKAQSYRNFKIIFANDHSTDNTHKILKQFKNEYNNVTIIDTKENGKKNALKEAISIVDTPYVYCTDADCTLTKNLLEIVVQQFEQQQSELIIGGVKLSYNNTLFQKIQTIEFESLIASGAAAALAHKPFLCNGANLAFTLKSWKTAQHHLVEQQLSGDDIFLLQYLKSKGAKIDFLKHPHSFVTTLPVTTLKQFFNQRKRWGSKTTAYTDKFSIFIACLVFLLCLGMVMTVISTILIPHRWLLTLMIFGGKLFFDAWLLIPFFKFTQQTELIMYIPLVAIVYPFYIVIAAIGSLLGNFKWK